jgi:hypothetical protein
LDSRRHGLPKRVSLRFVGSSALARDPTYTLLHHCERTRRTAV